MDKKELKAALKNIEGAYKQIEKGNSKFLFFVADSKGTPVGSLTYTYELAYKLHELGYNVQMLYAEKEFVGVKDWLGEKYASLPHYDTSKSNIDISPADFLFIPELFSNVMTKTRNLPCKKIAILQNFHYFTELIPLGSTWEKLGIRDCITTSKSMESRIKEVFPNLKTYVIRPTIDEIFKKDEKSKLIVNIVCKDQNLINEVVKPFKWRYPLYDFVSFRWVSGRSRQEEAEFLRDGAITVWLDEQTDFGYSALEAMASGNVVIGKVPENVPDWMCDENGEIKDCGVWFYRLRDLPPILASVIQTVLYDRVPEELFKNAKETLAYFSNENYTEEVKEVLDEIVDFRGKELSVMISSLKNNLEKEDKQ